MIDSFSGSHRFLSNFWPVPSFKGLTVEHYFAAAKCARKADADKILAAKSPGLAKRLGREVELREDWDAIRVDTMTRLVRMKFLHNDVLASQLVATGTEELVEGNTWGDTFWGVDADTRKGENHLGQILMDIRDELQNSGKYESNPDADTWELDI